MMLYLMRHGIAEDAAPSGGDSERRLTQDGTLRTAMVAKCLNRLGLSFDCIVSSPYVRARETAQIVSRITEHTETPSLDSRLAPFASFDDVCELIAEHSDVDALLLTGHEPSMSTFISGLVGDGRLTIEVKKASVTAIALHQTRKPARGALLWSIPPKLFERLS